MAIISDEPYEKRGGDDSGRDSLNFTPETHHVGAVDTPKGGDPANAKESAREVQEADPHESRCARSGASWATESGGLRGDAMPFTPTAGLFTSGASVSECFESALRASGGVRQGPEWCSDPAPGVARVLCDHTITLDQLHKQDEGSGHTFETQRRANWSHDKWGG